MKRSTTLEAWLRRSPESVARFERDQGRSDRSGRPDVEWSEPHNVLNSIFSGWNGCFRRISGKARGMLYRRGRLGLGTLAASKGQCSAKGGSRSFPCNAPFDRKPAAGSRIGRSAPRALAWLGAEPPGSVDLRRMRQVVEAALADADAGGDLEGDEAGETDEEDRGRHLLLVLLIVPPQPAPTPNAAAQRNQSR